MAVAQVVQDEVARDLEHPGAVPGCVRLRHFRARDAQKHFLRQVLGSLRPADHPAQVPEHPLPVQGEKDFSCGHAFLWDMNPRRSGLGPAVSQASAFGTIGRLPVS